MGLEALGENCFQAHFKLFIDSISCGCRTKVLFLSGCHLAMAVNF